MKPSDEILVTRFIDGELEGEELAAFEARLEKEPELLAAIEGGSDIGESIREAFAGGDVMGHDMLMAATSLSEIEIPNPDFFNSKVLGEIEESAPAKPVSPTRAPKRNSGQQGFFHLIGLGWAVAGVAAIALVGVLLVRPGGGQDDRLDPTKTTASSLYAPDAGIEASSFYSDEADAMVIALDGLEEIPTDTQIVGYHLDSYEPAGDLASHTLYSTDGTPVLAVATDSSNRPTFIPIVKTRG